MLMTSRETLGACVDGFSVPNLNRLSVHDDEIVVKCSYPVASHRDFLHLILSHTLMVLRFAIFASG